LLMFIILLGRKVLRNLKKDKWTKFLILVGRGFRSATSL
jgi:hypothetical protein